MVHQMGGFLVSRERKRYQSLKLLIIIQVIESDQSLSENLVRITRRRSMGEIQYLRCSFLW